MQTRMFHLAILGCLLLCAETVRSADHAEHFDTAPTGWQTWNGSWNASSGEYVNVDVLPGPTSPNPTISYYGGKSWTTNYTLNARLMSEYPGANNKVGIVFAYVSSTNYLQLLVNMDGQVTLNRISGATVIPLENADTDEFGVDLADDTWFDVRVFVNGSDVTVSFNNKVVLRHVGVGTLPTGNVGFIANSDKGHFDDLTVTENGAGQIFRATFSGASVGAPVECTTNGANEKNCWADVDGEDASGFDWPLKLWGAHGRFQLISRDPDSYANILNHVKAEVLHLAVDQGRTGITDALHQEVLQDGDTGTPQIPDMIPLKDSNQPQGDLYARFWIKLQGDLKTKLTNSWRMPFQFKTAQRYRLSLFIDTWNTSDPQYVCAPPVTDHTPHWRLQADSWAAVEGGDTYWQKCNAADTPATAVPIGAWFKLEIFFHRTNGSSPGRIWVAMNGTTLFDEHPTDGLNGHVADGSQTLLVEKIDRLMLPQLYAGGSYPQEQWVDDLELWDGFPANASAH
jgi:hypothetical protein